MGMTPPGKRLTICAAVVLGISPGLPSQANDLGDQMSAQMSCYVRSYDTAHLSAHPLQRVTTISLRPEPAAPQTDGLVLRLGITLRGDSEEFAGAAYCDPRGADLRCAMEGDAGGFTLQAAKGGAVILRVGRDGIGFEGATGFVTLSGTDGDDRIFLIPPAPCR